MHKRIVCLIMGIILFTYLFLTDGKFVSADENNMYKVYIMDEANLLNQNEREKLEKVMKKITQYGSAIFITTNHPNTSSTKYFAEKMYVDLLN